MKKIIISQLFVVATMLNLSLYSQENKTKTFEQREQEVNALMQQELKKDTPIDEIHEKLSKLLDQTDEGRKYEQIHAQCVMVASKVLERRRQCCKSVIRTHAQAASSWSEQYRQEAYNMVWQCEAKCEKECHNLKQEIDKLGQEYNKANKALWNTPEGKAIKKLLKIKIKESKYTNLNL